MQLGVVEPFGADDELQENMMDLLVDTPITEPDAEGKKSDIIVGKSASPFPFCPVLTSHVSQT